MRRRHVPELIANLETETLNNQQKKDLLHVPRRRILCRRNRTRSEDEIDRLDVCASNPVFTNEPRFSQPFFVSTLIALSISN